MTYMDLFCNILENRLKKAVGSKDNQINFYEAMTAETKRQYDNGDGDEIASKKIYKTRSSSAMIYNFLGNEDVQIINNDNLPAGKYKKEYEKQLQTLINNKCANLDAWLYNDNTEIFIESKCLEWIENGTEARLRKKYYKKEYYFDQVTADKFIETAKKISCSQYDSCQMFKHTLGIYNYLKDAKIENKTILLLNVVWELPEDEKIENPEYEDRYKLQERLEHLEFDYFYKQMTEIITLIHKETECDFDIKYMTAKDFCAALKMKKDRKEYLNRYMNLDYLFEQGFGKTESIEIAERLLQDKTEIVYSTIKSRPDGYFVEEHNSLIRDKKNYATEGSIEKKTFRDAIINNYEKYGIDYEINIVPGTKRNVDVLFIHNGNLFIGEAKGPGASGNDPLLRAVLEIYTYSQLVNVEQLFSDYCERLDWVKNKLSNKTDLKLAIIIFEKEDDKFSPMYRQLIEEDKYLPVRNLMKQLKVYAVKAESFCNGEIKFFNGYSPSDY